MKKKWSFKTGELLKEVQSYDFFYVRTIKR